MGLFSNLTSMHADTETKLKQSAPQWADLTKNTYEAKVIHEALTRSGNNPQLKGIIHEILIKDGINYNLANVVNGVHASLTKNPTARTVDIVVKQGNKIVQRIQAKDTLSSISKVTKQIQSGQYNSAQIFATKETAKKLSHTLTKIGISKPVTSSGISANTTSALAVKAGVSGFSGLSKACSTAAKGGAVVGAAVGTSLRIKAVPLQANMS